MARDYFDRQAPTYQKRSESGVWGWLRRREAEAVLGLLGDVRGCAVLDLGCGTGYYARKVLELGAAHVVAVDTSAAMLSQLPAKDVTPVLADAATVDVAQRFSMAIAAGLLEFVHDDRAVLKNARRLMNPDGAFVVLVPRDCLAGRGYWAFHRIHRQAVRLYTASSLRAAAEKSGWRLETTRPAGLFALAARMTVLP